MQKAMFFRSNQSSVLRVKAQSVAARVVILDAVRYRTDQMLVHLTMQAAADSTVYVRSRIVPSARSGP